MFGAEFYGSDAKILMGSDYWPTPVVDIIDSTTFVGTQTVVTISYPHLAGSQLSCRRIPNKHFETVYPSATNNPPSTVNFSFSYGLGYPVGTFTRSSTGLAGTVLEVFVDIESTINYGFCAYDTLGKVASSADASSYKLLGKFNVAQSYTVFNYYNDNGYPSSTGRFAIEHTVVAGQAMWSHEFYLPASLFPALSRPVFMVSVPDAPAGVRVHSVFREGNGSGGYTGAWRVRVATFGGHNPTLYVFDSDSSAAPQPSNGYGMELFNSSGTRVFSTNDKMLVTLPRQLVSLTTPQDGSGTLSTVESVTISAITYGGVPLCSGQTPRNWIQVYMASKNYAYLTGHYGKYWSRVNSTTLECRWHLFFARAPIDGTDFFSAAYDFPGQFSMYISNSALYG